MWFHCVCLRRVFAAFCCLAFLCGRATVFFFGCVFFFAACVFTVCVLTDFLVIVVITVLIGLLLLNI